MPARCTICHSPRRGAIERALVSRELSFHAIARRYAVSKDALLRHDENHVPETLRQAEAARREGTAIDVLAELEACMTRAKLLHDAVDDWLRDPDDPTRYSVDPHAEEVRVTFWQRGKDGCLHRRKKWLSELLAIVAKEASDVELVEVKRADPRTLLLRTQERLEAQLELLSRLLGKLKDPGMTVNVLLSPEWRAVQTVIMEALAGQPLLRQRVAERLAAMSAMQPVSEAAADARRN